MMAKDLTVIIPVYNEVNYIDALLRDLLANSLTIQGREIDTEFLIVDGGSNDGTLKKIDKYLELDHRIRLIKNKKKFQVHGLNLALKHANGNIIIRCDAHSRYPIYYLKKLYKYLHDNPEVGNVGFRSITKAGESTMEAEVVTDILSSTLGVGSSHRNINLNSPVEVDTLLFGAWHKKIFEEVGVFDEDFIRGQDYEHNFRILKHGKKVIIIPDGEFFYITRSSIFKMFQMIFQYAHAKIHIIKKHKRIPTVRSFAPTMLWISIILIPLNQVFALPAAAYLILVSYTSFKLSAKHRFKSFLLYSFGYIGMHGAYFIGVVKGFYDYYVINKNYVKFNDTR